MIIFIDGYNVLKNLHEGSTTHRDRNFFIEQLKKYSAYKKHAIVLVFDGGPSDAICREEYGGVRVIYAGRYTADEMLIHEIGLVAKDKVLLITDDRALCSGASNMGCASMGVQDFYYYLKAALQAKSKMPLVQRYAIVKTSSSTDKELDDLMRAGSTKAAGKQDDYASQGSMGQSSAKESKLNRRLLAMIRKL